MDDDDTLESLRKKRMAELSGQSGQEEAMQRAEKARQMQEQRRLMIAQILTTDARARLSNIALVKPQRAREVEDSLIRAAQSGQLPGRVDESTLRSMLGQLSEKKKKTSTISFQRKRYSIEEEEEEDDGWS